jgi:RimJ/RimL family protein N-acetyltransferase
MDKALTLVFDAVSPVSLHTIGAGDLEDLRVWKNSNRQAFFFKDEITSPMQKKWFQGYLARPQDVMFIVKSCGLRAGCMGFRVQGGAADCYNIIGLPAVAGRGIMTVAMRLMCSFILAEQAPVVGLKVLKDNPAAGWYQKKCCFGIVSEGADYLQLRLDRTRFQACGYEKILEVGK